MNRFLLATAALTLLSAASANAAGWESAGNGTVYTFADLSRIDGSGVTFDGSFTVSDDVTIAAGDTLKMDNGARVCINAKKTITVKGYADFTPAVPSIITKIDSLGAPKGIKTAAGGRFSNILFEYAAIYNTGDQPISVEGCTFQYVTSAMNSTGCIAFAGTSAGSVIKGNTFYNNDIVAVGSGATNYCGMTIEGNFIYDCNTANSNRPMLNMTAPGAQGPLIIRNNVIVGTGRLKVGGISVSNLMGGSTGFGEVIVEGNTVRNCRYGLNLQGGFHAEVRNNAFYDNRYESVPNNGGSGISCYDTTGLLEAIVSGNHIEGSLWGMTIIGPKTGSYKGFKYVNLGQPGNKEIDSPGGNVFVNNGNDGEVYDYEEHPYDVYNNSPDTIYAQNNTWSVPDQTPEQIAKVIYDYNDDETLGIVIFEKDATGAAAPKADSQVQFDTESGMLLSGEEMTSVMVYNMEGRCVYGDKSRTTSLSLGELPTGVYLVSVTTPSGIKSLKIAVK